MRRESLKDHCFHRFPLLGQTFLLLLIILTMVPVIPAMAQGPKYGGKLVIGIEGNCLGFDAIKAGNLWGAGYVPGNLVMERLFELGPNEELIPVLGLSAEPSSDGKIWTVKLRQGVKFHDGTPFDADAVVKHWERLLNPKNRYRGRSMMTPIESVEKNSEFEVVFHLKHAWLPFLDVLTSTLGFTPLIPSPKAVADDIHNRAPVGTGPFVFKEWKPGDRVVITRNPNYWQKGKPYLDEVVVMVMSDHETRYAALTAGEVDMMVTDRPQHIGKLIDDPKFNSRRWNAGIGFLALNTQKAPLNDIRVRQALAHAWDQDKYLKASFKGIYEPAHDVFGGNAGCDDVGYRETDLEKCKSLIDEHDGPVEIEYLHSATQRGRETGAIVQQIFKQAGVTVRPVPLEWAAIFKKVFGRDYDMASWIAPYTSDMGPVLSAYFYSKGPWNVTGFSNKEVDELLVEQRMSTDPEERKKIFCRIAQILNEEVPIIFIFRRDYYVFSDKRIKGIEYPKYTIMRLSNVWLEE